MKRFNRDRFHRRSDYIQHEYGWIFFVDWWIKVASKMTEDEFHYLYHTERSKEYHITRTREILVRAIDKEIGVNK